MGTKLKNVKTSEEYVEEFGKYCIFCNSSDLEAERVEIGEGQAWQNITCTKCSGKWTDSYTLKGYLVNNSTEEVG